jgi:hypothetical protein
VTDDEEDEEYPEYQASFVGPCTCDHEQEDHTWGSCSVEENGVECPCEAGWQE